MNPTQARSWAKAAGLSLRYDIEPGVSEEALSSAGEAGVPSARASTMTRCSRSPCQGSASEHHFEPGARLRRIAHQVVQLDVDQDTAAYIAGSQRARHGRFKTWLHRTLRGVLSDFDINGYLGTYPMHVLSTPQWEVLLDRSEPTGRLLDIGSGRGDVTACLSPLFEHVTVTETSRGMSRRLGRQGFSVIEGDITGWKPKNLFDAVSLLNVLDRCDRPLSLLGTARSFLQPGGLLIVALVLPYRPFVYDKGRSRAPTERLPITSSHFEAAALEFVELALVALGLEVVTISRTPYLSGGDAHRPLYELDDLIVICRALGPPPPILGCIS